MEKKSVIIALLSLLSVCGVTYTAYLKRDSDKIALESVRIQIIADSTARENRRQKRHQDNYEVYKNNRMDSLECIIVNNNIKSKKCN